MKSRKASQEKGDISLVLRVIAILLEEVFCTEVASCTKRGAVTEQVEQLLCLDILWKVG